MNRKQFLEHGVALGALTALGGAGPVTRSGAAFGAPALLGVGPRAADLVLRRATVFDGSGSSGREADVAVTGDRITAVGQVSGAGAVEIDLAGRALAPGFIDIHSHADLSLLINPPAESRLRQGITTEVVGQDGSSVGPWPEGEFEAVRDRYASRFGITIDFRDPAGFLDRLARETVAVNVATMLGHGTIRRLVVGLDDRPPSDEELLAMQAQVRTGLEAGAVGLSSGLEYTPGGFADRSELVALASVLAGTGLPYASHMRNEDDELLAAVEEAIHVGRLAGVPVQISHLKAQGQRNWWKADAALSTIEAAREAGVDVHFDRYPYVAYATGLSNLFPAEARRGGTDAFLARLADPAEADQLERACRAKVALLGSWDAVQISSTRTGRNRIAEGRRLGELAAELGEDPYQLTVRLLTQEEGGVGMIGFGMSEENTARIVAHPLGMVCSDGGAYAPYGPLSEGSPHPRSYGTFPRVLGTYVRDRGDMDLGTAIKKITSMPAAKLRLEGRGVLRVGAYADLVAFDPATVRDGATFENPHQYPAGIELVVVNGALGLRDGEQTGALGGRPLRADSQ